MPAVERPEPMATAMDANSAPLISVTMSFSSCISISTIPYYSLTNTLPNPNVGWLCGRMLTT